MIQKNRPLVFVVRRFKSFNYFAEMEYLKHKLHQCIFQNVYFHNDL